MIFEEQISRKPDNYPWARTYINAMWTGQWTANKFNFQSDEHNYRVDLNNEEREIIRNTLSCIGQVEIAVKKFWANLGYNLPHPSLTDLGYCMANIEVIHNVAYEKLLECLHLENIFEENLKLPIIKGRVDYLRKYQDKAYKDDKKQYVYALSLFTLFVENVSLFSQFYIILWFNKNKDVLKDTAQQIQYTKNEETIHALVGIKLINTIREEHPELFDDALEEKIKSEAMEAYKAESKIVDWMLKDYVDESISAEIVKEYIKNRINESLEAIGYSAIFEIDEELIKQTIWMDEVVYGNANTDFFHQDPVEYSKSGMVFSAEELF